jgi:hypothetical protein
VAHHSSHAELPLTRLHRLPPGLRAAVPVLVALGAIGLVTALVLDPARGWRAYLINWLFFTSVAQGALLLATVVSITKGLWSRPIRRFALSFVAFMPLAWLALIPLFFAAGHIFPWIAEPIPGKGVWLNVPFLTVRNLLLFGALVVLDLAFAYYALRPDLGLVRDQVPPRLRQFYLGLTARWRGQEAEELRSHRRLLVLAPALAMTYALAMSMIAWDFVMSLEPHWFSTLLGPYFFMGAFLGGIMATALMTLLYRDQFELGRIRRHAHDLGKLGRPRSLQIFFSQYIDLVRAPAVERRS